MRKRNKIAVRENLALSGVLIATFLLAACGDTSGADTRIENVDAFLARICERAARCPGISATQDDVDACPLGIRTQLSQAQLNELERFTTYTERQQDCILECIGNTICGRFGGALSSISDSDVLEPFAACEQQCP